MKKKKLTIALIGIVLVLCVIFFALLGNPFILKNNYDFGRSVKAITSENVVLNEITPFEWDIVYTFQPYTPKRSMEEVIGFKSNYISETLSEGMTHLIFVKGNKVVSSINGYISSLGYSVSFLTDGEYYSKINYEDNAVFSVNHVDNIVALSHSK